MAESAEASGVSLKGNEPAVTPHRGRAVNSDTPEIAIPPDVLRNWQRMVDLLANIVRVPSAVVCKLEPPDDTFYRIVANSSSEGNPFRMDETFSMDIGTFCETVIKSREPLLVANALEDDQWKSAPEIRVGMIRHAWKLIPFALTDAHGNTPTHPHQRLSATAVCIGVSR